MESLFEFVINLVVGQFKGAFFIFALVGFVIALTGLMPIILCTVFRFLAKPAMLEVVKLHETVRKIKDTDDAERIAEKKARPVIHVEFLVLDGHFRGMRKKSGSGSNHPKHKLGDVVKGYYAPHKDGQVMSAAELCGGYKLGFILMACGIGFVILMNYMVGIIEI